MNGLRPSKSICLFQRLDGGTPLTRIVWSLFVYLSIHSAAWAQTSPPRLNEANTLLRRGDVTAAMQMYQELATTEGESAALQYNRGIAFHSLGDLAAAKEDFRHAASAENTQIAANARYNLGNCYYEEALQIAAQNANGASEHLREAIACYRDALRIDPSNAEARINLEIAAKMLRKLDRSQYNQQKPPKPQDSAPNDDRSVEKQEAPSPEAQQQNSDQATPTKSQKQQPEVQPAESEEKKHDGEMKQQENGAPQQDKQQRMGNSRQQQEPLQRAKTDQAEAATGTEPAQDAASPLQPANKSMNPALPGDSKAGPSASPADESAPVTPPPSDGTLSAATPQGADSGEDDAKQGPRSVAIRSMTQEEALKMLQSVRDRDLLRRLRKQQVDQTRKTPVDRDW
jgi:Ca-activated chloride channel homolog